MRRSGSTKGATSKSTSELVRQAEQHIGAKEFAKARALLETAQSVDPLNEYIAAMLKRTIQSEKTESKSKGKSAKGSPDPDSAADAPLTPEQENIRSQVQRLTMVARGLFERGAYESAFTVLTRAFLLDPLSEDVRQAERDILPTIEKMRERESPEALASPVSVGVTVDQQIPGADKSPAVISRDFVPTENDARLEQLMRQKEQERLERDRAMWRKASEAPKPIGATEEEKPPEHAPPDSSPDSEEKPQKGLLSRFRRGKRTE